MKKIIALLCGILVLGSVGCTATDSNAENPNPQENVSVEEKKEEKEKSPVTIEEVPFEVTILEPDSIGQRYMQATYTNNSKYAIKNFTVAVLLKDKNETVYLGSYDTVMPGETSPNFETFGPDTGSPDDIEYIKFDIQAVDENGKDIFITYDAKLKTYSWL